MIVLTSWDDGHPDDVRLADILARFKLQGTFFVPVRNIEGLPVMGPRDLRHLASQYEIASHTQDHRYLVRLSREEATIQIESGKAMLEDILSRPVGGFCYPGGKVNRAVRRLVEQSGFAYARTTRNFLLNPGQDRLMMPTTLQVFPHARSVYVRNYLRWGNYSERAATFGCLFDSGTSFVERFRAVLDCAHAMPDSVIHLWGHSWELSRFDLWKTFEQILRLTSEYGPTSMTLMEYWSRRNLGDASRAATVL